ncbi:MAG: amino acid--tRNA ligase-related protein, partial [Terriglobales bacterium]
WSAELLAETARRVTGGTEVSFRGHGINFGAVERLALREAIVRFWPEGAGPAPTLVAVHDPAQEDAIAETYNRFASGRDDYRPIGGTAADGQGARLIEVFEQVAERHLIQPTIIYDFPMAVSPLAKNKPDEPAWVERFEIYAGGMEIANGYSELNDPEEQHRRFEQQGVVDEDYVRALRYGMPPTAGEGIGIDRLTMLLTGSDSIRDVILFPLLRPEGGPA